MSNLLRYLSAGLTSLLMVTAAWGGLRGLHDERIPTGPDALGAKATRGIFLQASGALLSRNPGVIGGELGIAALTQPFEGRGLLTGIRVAGILGTGDLGRLWALAYGLEGTLWMANALGPGIAVDLITPSRQGDQDLDPHFRAEGFVATRVKRIGESGAWALRMGAVYNSEFRWGFKAGLVLQFSGVPNIGAVE